MSSDMLTTRDKAELGTQIQTVLRTLETIVSLSAGAVPREMAEAHAESVTLLEQLLREHRRAHGLPSSSESQSFDT